MRHDVVWALFPVLPSDLCGSPYLASEEELIAAGLGPYLNKCLTVTGGGCRIDASVNLKLLLGKSLSFIDKQGCKTAPRPLEKSSNQVYKELFCWHPAFMKMASLEATKWNKSFWATVVFIHSYTVTYWLVEKAFPDNKFIQFLQKYHCSRSSHDYSQRLWTYGKKDVRFNS